MPYQTPSASQFIQLKRLQSSQTANKNINPLQVRIVNPYNGYQHGITSKFGNNALLSNKFTNINTIDGKQIDIRI